LTTAILRLQSTTDFERVRRDGRSYAHPLVVLVACRGEDATAGLPTRVGYTAGRSLGSAVRRNRAKRLMREAVRALAPRVAGGWDLVLIARAPIVGCKMPEVQGALFQLMKKAHLLESASV
jgi:ribonuclease P protein component